MRGATPRPDGNFDELEASGAKQKSDSSVVLKVGLSNLNGWMLAVLYATCFGVELTVTNEAALYFNEYHGAARDPARSLRLPRPAYPRAPCCCSTPLHPRPTGPGGVQASRWRWRA